MVVSAAKTVNLIMDIIDQLQEYTNKNLLIERREEWRLNQEDMSQTILANL